MSDQSQQDQAQQARQAQAQSGEMRREQAQQAQAQAGEMQQAQQAQQAQQSGARSRTGNGNGNGNGQWRQFGKHVRRIVNAGFNSSQAAEIVEVQREVATETTDSMAERFVTREHFDAAVAGLNSEVGNLRQHVDSAVERLCERIEALEKSFDERMKLLMWGAGIGMTLLGALLVALLSGGVMVVLHLLGG